MDTLRVLLYPSPEVLFPGQLLSLDGAEEGWLKALRICQEQCRPVGVAFAYDATADSLMRVGTLASLVMRDAMGRRLPGGIGAMGVARFNLLQIHQDLPYPEATVQLCPWLESPAPPWQVVEGLGIYLRRYINALAEMLPPNLLPEVLSPNAATLGVLGAAMLTLPPFEKQRLLEIPTAQNLLTEVLHYMQIYVPLAETVAARAPRVPEGYYTISSN